MHDASLHTVIAIRRVHTLPNSREPKKKGKGMETSKRNANAPQGEVDPGPDGMSELWATGELWGGQGGELRVVYFDYRGKFDRTNLAFLGSKKNIGQQLSSRGGILLGGQMQEKNKQKTKTYFTNTIL